MLPRVSALCLTALLCLFTASPVVVRAVTNWASAEALGDVAVAFDNEVRVFDNADGTETDAITGASLAGTNRGLAFDAALNLFVANTDFVGNGRVVVLGPLHPHGQVRTIPTQALPASLTLAANGTLYVAHLGGVIQRFTPAGALSGTFTIPAESADCIGIDLAPDQDTLFAVTGGRTVLQVTGVSTATGAATSTVFTSLPNPGKACGLRLLPPVDVRATPAPPVPSPIHGGMIVADARNIKRLSSSGAVLETFTAGAGPDSQKEWIDVALDPNTRDFWAIDANFFRLARFRLGQPSASLSLFQFAAEPRGVAVNGELRAAQTVQLVNLTAGVEGGATFLQGTAFQHAWRGTLDVSALLAIQAFEVTHAESTEVPDNGLCPPSLNIDCRLFNFPDATPKAYSRGRSVVYREIQRTPIPEDTPLKIGVVFTGLTDITAGDVCVVGGTPRTGSSLLRDPWPHDLFSLDVTLVFYGGDDGVYGRTRTNDSIAVDRGNARYFLRIISPSANTRAQRGSTLTVSVETRDPLAGCAPVAGLENLLVLSVTDITPGPDKGRVIGDSQNVIAPINSNGLVWASVANLYRTNLDIDSRYQKNHTYRMCVAAPAGLTIDGIPVAGEVCRDFSVK